MGPPSYSAYDVGKAGVPRVSVPRRAQLRKLEEHDPKHQLRFAILPKHLTILYIATDGPCASVMYPLLDTGFCSNMVYMPADAPYDISAGAPC